MSNIVLPAHAFPTAVTATAVQKHSAPETGMGAIDFFQVAKDLVSGRTTQQQGTPTPTGADGRPVTGVMNPPAPLARTPQGAPAPQQQAQQSNGATVKAQQNASLRVGAASVAMLALGVGSYYIMEKNTSYRGVKAGAVAVVGAVATLLLWNAADPIEQPATSKK